MSQFFELNADQIRVRDILGKKHFLEIEIYAISDAYPNNNKSHFTLNSLKNSVDTFIDKPILGFFNKGDFVAHQGRANYDPELDLEYWDNSDGEQILGFIREGDQREVVEHNGLNWIRCTAMLCTRYNYKQIKKLLKDKQKKVSVEIDIKEQEVDENGIVIINKFELLGITVLGSRNGVAVKEGIEGANLSVLDLMDSLRYNGQQQALMFEYSQLENNNKEEDNLANEDIGTMSAPEVDESQVAMSDASCENCCKDYDNGESQDVVRNDETDCDCPDNHDDQGEEQGDEHENMEDGGCVDAESSEDVDQVVTEDCEQCVDERYVQLEHECDELRMRCNDFDGKCIEYEKRCTEYESICNEYEHRIAELEEQNKLKYEECENVKMALNEANDKLASIFVAEQCKYIDTMSRKMKFGEEDIKGIKEKCERHEYASNEEIDRDMAYIMFQKKSFDEDTENTQFSADIVNVRMPEVIVEENRKAGRENQSVVERLKNNLKK